MRTSVKASLAAVLISLLLSGAGAFYVHGDYAAARKLFARGEHREARKRLLRYLRLFPRDYQARLSLAEVIVADDDRPSDEVAREALSHLARIPDDAPQAAEARTHSGRLLFLILLRPGEAEGLFQHAIELNPSLLDAQLMLWNLLNVTGRFHLTEPLFWRVYELTPPAEKPLRLRDWYLTEFGRGAAFIKLDRRLGVLGETDRPSVQSELDRLLAIRAAEPEWPIAIAAMARLLRGEGQKDIALELIRLATPEADQDPFFLATRIELAMDAGQFDEARELFGRWPAPHEGYEYWLWRGTIADEIERDDTEAINCYEQALRAPLADTDWQLMNRLAHCQLRAGRAEDARQTRERAGQIENLMARETHLELRKAFAELENPTRLREIIAFYRNLRREHEVAEWTAWLDQVLARLPAADTAP